MRLVISLFAIVAATIAATAQTAPPAGARATATFAGGCFWCVEADFDRVAGVLSTTSGYIGGTVADPKYEDVVRGGTGHTEAVEIVFDPSKVTFDKLLHVFWRNHDPLAKHRQFCDRGTQYRPGIFYHDDAQRQAAEKTKAAAQARFAPRVVQTEITQATAFYKAEGYHQDYYLKNPLRYKFYRLNCGRDARLEELWGKPES
ncbi:MAG: peptide-methionine (S)-S-oxide reductase MsrA [Xanthobacteraceae bacterium]